MKRVSLVILMVVALLAMTMPIAGAAKKVYSIGAASPGGTYYPYASGWSELLKKKADMDVIVEVTGGATDNIRLVDSGEVEFGMATISTAYEAFQGMAPWTRKHTNIRAIIPSYTNFFHFYVRGGIGINNVHDLAGKRVQLGPAGSTQDYYGRAILKVLGIEPARIINVPYSDANNMIKDGLLDAAFLTAGLPNSSILELEVTHNISVIGISGKDAEKFIKEYPYFAVVDIPGGTYKCAPKAVPTLTSTNFIIANKDVPADVVYKAVKATFANVDIIQASHKSAKETKPEAASLSFIPLHAGAVKYYREVGIDVGNLVPPEMR